MPREIQLSCDGISETKSTSYSIDVYSMRFKNCQIIYPIKLIRPMPKYKYDHNKQLGEVIQDLNANSLEISQYIADNLKRANAKHCKNHASWFPCEYCMAKGTKIDISDNSKAKKKLLQQKQAIEEKIDEYEHDEVTPETDANIQNLISLKNELQKSIDTLQRKSNILWPASTMNATHRSRASILAIVERIENEENLSIDEAKGITGRSLLLDLPYFNYVYDVPAEYLHSGCLGVIKRLVLLTFDVGEKRPRITTRKLSSVANFNAIMLKTKVHKESSRRARKLDFAVFKGQEFRNIAIFYFVLVLECIEEGAKERNLWLNLAYMLRSALIPSNEFSHIDIDVVNNCCTYFYHVFEELFGTINCPYNLHVFCSHLMEIRTHGPLTETSAFKFEAFYGEIRRSFVPGTVSPLKQIMKNIMLKRKLKNHVCENDIFISNYNTPLESNNMIYTYCNKEYKVYEIVEINDDFVTCQKVGLYNATFPETPEINWATVGVFRKGGVSSENVSINTNDIKGKVLNVGKYLLTCPINVLNEK